ncbi:MerR family DNA-binding transcriptional regulator [Sphingomonas sp.]|jgi:DNA-binding transcriptional MerR regulator|uniref:MerR family transcriptional regulator n=1 Tax=Sphingomonas sp. TaxID=28214 RepID=UPI000C510E9D|nr:MerR family transcriptional regulator [Sphingomonas sp.]
MEKTLHLDQDSAQVPASSADASVARHEPRARGDTDSRVQGIQDVAKELGLTLRTLRFYEKEGLIFPQRVGNTRAYSKREIGRIQLILRGKRLGFSIKEIKEFLDLYDADPDHKEQMERLIARIRERLVDLKSQRTALDLTIEELTLIEKDALEKLHCG